MSFYRVRGDWSGRSQGALKPGFITGKTLINLDSEDEGELFVGCAGGLDTTGIFRYGTSEIAEGTRLLSFRIYNGLGGHSGDDIDKGRANAVQLLARFLYPELGSYSLCSIEGGNKRNAIAREAGCVVAVKGDGAELQEHFRIFSEEVRAEYAIAEPRLSFECKEVNTACRAISDHDARRIVSALVAAPHGVLAMSREIEGLVETSSNLASVRMLDDGTIRVGSSQRSSVNSARKAAGDRMQACLELAGAEVTHENEYPGWQPDMNSRILGIARNAYRELFGEEPRVRAIHAGLECGLFLDVYPGLDMISFGPTLRGVHAPGERLELASLDRFVALLDKIVTEFA